ncbi:BNI1-related protein 1 [Nakaseomyces bracarensis]|uniref:BNI1-related protein 1 n=1 Tax=Nakaseomyces bracarensis TaxID=273131 RepID=A0ABR4NUZ3_9SACH
MDVVQRGLAIVGTGLNEKMDARSVPEDSDAVDRLFEAVVSEGGYFWGDRMLETLRQGPVARRWEFICKIHNFERKNVSESRLKDGVASDGDGEVQDIIARLDQLGEILLSDEVDDDIEGTVMLKTMYTLEKMLRQGRVREIFVAYDYVITIIEDTIPVVLELEQLNDLNSKFFYIHLRCLKSLMNSDEGRLVVLKDSPIITYLADIVVNNIANNEHFQLNFLKNQCQSLEILLLLSYLDMGRGYKVVFEALDIHLERWISTTLRNSESLQSFNSEVSLINPIKILQEYFSLFLFLVNSIIEGYQSYESKSIIIQRFESISDFSKLLALMEDLRDTSILDNIKRFRDTKFEILTKNSFTPSFLEGVSYSDTLRNLILQTKNTALESQFGQLIELIFQHIHTKTLNDSIKFLKLIALLIPYLEKLFQLDEETLRNPDEFFQETISSLVDNLQSEDITRRAMQEIENLEENISKLNSHIAELEGETNLDKRELFAKLKHTERLLEERTNEKDDSMRLIENLRNQLRQKQKDLDQIVVHNRIASNGNRNFSTGKVFENINLNKLPKRSLSNTSYKALYKSKGFRSLVSVINTDSTDQSNDENNGDHNQFGYSHHLKRSYEPTVRGPGGYGSLNSQSNVYKFGDDDMNSDSIDGEVATNGHNFIGRNTMEGKRGTLVKNTSAKKPGTVTGAREHSEITHMDHLPHSFVENTESYNRQNGSNDEFGFGLPPNTILSNNLNGSMDSIVSGDSELMEREPNRNTKNIPDVPPPPMPSFLKNNFNSEVEQTSSDYTNKTLESSSTASIPKPPPPPPPPPPPLPDNLNKDNQSPLKKEEEPEEKVFPDGIPPPPPPLPSNLVGISNSVKSSVRLKQIHWDKVEDVGGTIWEDNLENVVDDLQRGGIFKQIEDYFKVIEPIKRPKLNNEGNNKPSKISFLSRDLAQQFGINLHMYSQLSIDDFVKKVLNCDNDLIQNVSILGFFNKEELIHVPISLERKLAPYGNNFSSDDSPEKDPTELERADQIYTALCYNLRSYWAERSQCLLTLTTYEKDYFDLMYKLEKIDEAIQRLFNSSRLKNLLVLIKEIGNYMNKGTVTGIKLSSLAKFSFVKSSTEKNISFLHFVERIIREKFPDVYSFTDDIAKVEDLGKVTLEHVELECEEFSEKIKTVVYTLTKGKLSDPKKLHPDDQVYTKLRYKVNRANAKSELLTNQYKLTKRTLERLMKYYGEDPMNKDSKNSFFGYFVEFSMMFKKCAKENIEREEMNRLYEQRKTMLEQRNKKNAEEVDYEDESNAVDDLLAKLRDAEKQKPAPLRRRRSTKMISGSKNEKPLLERTQAMLSDIQNI